MFIENSRAQPANEVQLVTPFQHCIPPNMKQALPVGAFEIGTHAFRPRSPQYDSPSVMSPLSNRHAIPPDRQLPENRVRLDAGSGLPEVFRPKVTDTPPAVVRNPGRIDAQRVDFDTTQVRLTTYCESLCL